MLSISKRININFSIYFLTLFYITFFYTNKFFGTNDDMLMMLLVSGIYTGEATEYIVFQNILIGLFLKQLYTFLPDINWYTLLLSSSQFIAFTSIYFLVTSFTSNKRLIFFLFVLPMLYFLVEFSIYLQFRVN